MNPGKCAKVISSYGQCHLPREKHSMKYYYTDSQAYYDLSDF